MSNPLTFINEAMSTIDDAFQVARKCAGLGHVSGVAGTQFDPPDLGYASALIDSAKQELDDLIVLGMVASFEAHLKNFIASRLKTTPGNFKIEIEEWITDRIETSPLYRIDKIFKPQVTQSMIDDVDDVRKYRNWVAHGRLSNRKPSIIFTPNSTYNALTQFMAAAGII